MSPRHSAYIPSSVKSSLKRLYLLGKNGRKHLTSVEETVVTTIFDLKAYVNDNKGDVEIALREVDDASEKDSNEKSFKEGRKRLIK